MSDIVKRLRSYADGLVLANELSVGPNMSRDAMLEAAARIEELEAENARLNKVVTDVANWLDDPTPHHIGGVRGANAIARSAIRNEALEEAALVADSKTEHYANLAYSPHHDKIQNAAKTYCAGEIADAIRALKSTNQS